MKGNKRFFTRIHYTVSLRYIVYLYQNDLGVERRLTCNWKWLDGGKVMLCKQHIWELNYTCFSTTFSEKSWFSKISLVHVQWQTVGIWWGFFFKATQNDLCLSVQCFRQAAPLWESRVAFIGDPQKNGEGATLALYFYKAACRLNPCIVF